MHTRHWGLSVFAMGCIFAFGVPAACGEDEIIEYIMMKQEAGRAAIRSFSVRTERTQTIVTRDTPEAVTTQHLFETIDRKERDGFMHVERLSQQESTIMDARGVTSPGPATLQRWLMARNNQYAAEWVQADGEVIEELQIEQYDGLDRITRNAAGRKTGVLVHDIMDYGYGFGRVFTDAHTMREFIVGHEHDWLVWTAERTGSGAEEMYVLTCRSTEWDNAVITVAKVDPNKGFLTTSLEYTSADPKGGSRRAQRWTIDAQEVAPGIWFPMSVHAFFDFPTMVEHPGTMEFIETVVGIEINQPIPDELFTWESLEPPDGPAVLRAIDGEPQFLRVAGNKLKPDPQFEIQRIMKITRGSADTPPPTSEPPDKSIVAPAPQPLAKQPDPPVGKAWSFVAVLVPALVILVVAVFLVTHNRRT